MIPLSHFITLGKGTNDVKSRRLLLMRRFARDPESPCDDEARSYITVWEKKIHRVIPRTRKSAGTGGGAVSISRRQPGQAPHGCSEVENERRFGISHYAHSSVGLWAAELVIEPCEQRRATVATGGKSWGHGRVCQSPQSPTPLPVTYAKLNPVLCMTRNEEKRDDW